MKISPPHRRLAPATIVTGFLGSGKTTLLNRLLHEDHGVRLAIIVNEFGEIGLDASLLSGSQDFVEMNNGCLCCALNEDLVRLLHTLRARGGYDAVVLETTGIADPLPIAWAFLKAEMQEAFRFAGIVTVADVLHLNTMLAQAAEARQQLERADYVYLAKTDLCDAANTAAVAAVLRNINPNARLVDCRDPTALRLLFATAMPAQAIVLPPALDTHHQPTFESVSIDLTGVRLDLERTEDFFEMLPLEVFRAKAVFDDVTGRTRVMHAVCGRVDFADAPNVAEVRAAVFIGRGIHAEVLRQNFRSRCYWK